MLSAEQNDSQSEEINVVDESQAENRFATSGNDERKKNQTCRQKVSLVGHFVCFA